MFEQLFEWLDSKYDDTPMTSPTYAFASGWNACLGMVKRYVKIQLNDKEDNDA